MEGTVHALPGSPAASPTLSGDRVVVPLDEGRTFAVNTDGSAAWDRSFIAENPGVRGAITALADGRLVQGSDWGTVEALDPKSGQAPKRWPDTRLFTRTSEENFEGIRDAVVPSADGRMLLAPAGDLGLLSLLSFNGQVCPIWPWTTYDPYGLPTTTPYRFHNSPLDLVTTDQRERLYATATLKPSLDFTVPTIAAKLLSGGFPVFDPTDRSGYGLLLCAPMDNPGNNYAIFYGDHTDHFIGHPIATSPNADDTVIAVTEGGRLYAFSAMGPQ